MGTRKKIQLFAFFFKGLTKYLNMTITSSIYKKHRVKALRDYKDPFRLYNLLHYSLTEVEYLDFLL